MANCRSDTEGWPTFEHEDEPFGRVGVQSGGRLVAEEHGRIGEHLGGEREPLALAARQALGVGRRRADGRAPALEQAQLGQQLLDAAVALRARQVVAHLQPSLNVPPTQIEDRRVHRLCGHPRSMPWPYCELQVFHGRQRGHEDVVLVDVAAHVVEVSAHGPAVDADLAGDDDAGCRKETRYESNVFF